MQINKVSKAIFFIHFTKRLFFFLFIGFLSISCAAQEWQTDFETAQSTATNTDKDILLVFQGSDWCIPCIKLDKEVWSKKAFQAYAEKHFIMLKADFPRRGKNKLTEDQQEHNNQLAETYNKNGYFPYVLVLDSKGNVKGGTGYKSIGVSGYIDLLDSFINN